MAGGRIAVALLVCLVAASVGWADPFSEVPPGHWAYGACTELAAAGLLSFDHPSISPGQPGVTRIEVAAAIVEPLDEVDRALQALPEKADAAAMRSAMAAALGIGPATPDAIVAKAAASLVRLATEFHEELRALDFDPARAVRGLELLENQPALGKWRPGALGYTGERRTATRRSPFGSDDLQVPVGHGSVAFSYNQGTGVPAIMDYAAMAADRITALGKGTSAGPSWTVPVTSRLRTAYEYGLGRALTLRLGYEEVARRGADDLPLDAASLTSLGVGLRLTPSTSVKLSYSLVDYQSYLPDTAPVREHLAETAVSVEF